MTPLYAAILPTHKDPLILDEERKALRWWMKILTFTYLNNDDIMFLALLQFELGET